MTDEEKFSEEEYKLAEEVIKPIYRNAMQNDFSFAKYGVECYQAGLKAGKDMNVPIKWHKVADGDLPKNENDVLIYSGEEWRMCVGRYSPKNKAWEAGCDTVAWCEIPEYKEE